MVDKTALHFLLCVIPGTILVCNFHGEVLYSNQASLESGARLHIRSMFPKELLAAVTRGLKAVSQASEVYRQRVVSDHVRSVWDVLVAPMDCWDQSPQFAIIIIPQVSSTGAESEPVSRAEIYSTLFKNISAAELIVDSETYDILDVNGAAERFYGWTRDTMRTMTACDITVTETPDMERHAALACMGRQEPFEVMHRIADGGVRWVRIFTSPVRMAGRTVLYCLVQDITQQSRVREILFSKERFLQAFLDSAPFMVFVKDAQGRFLFMNRAMETAFKIPEGACLGKVDRDTIPEELALRTEHNDKLVMRERRSMEFEEVVLIAGEQRIFQTTKVPMFDMHGNPYAVLGVAADITRFKKSEEALRRTRRNLELLIDDRTRELHKSKETLQILSRSLLSTQEAERRRIAQDIHDQAGEMITLVSIELESLRRRFPESADAVRLISANVTELSDTLRSICYGLHPVVLDRFGLSAAMEQFINEFQKGSSIEVISHIQCIHLEDLPPVIALCFYRALQESLTNIIRHAGACRASVWLSRKGCDLILTVEDTGRGFDTRMQSMGLGLLGMRERAAACGATLHMKSSIGEGATITLTYPLCAPQGEIL